MRILRIDPWAVNLFPHLFSGLAKPAGFPATGA